MKVSIITAAYNSQATIEGTIRSVLSQDYSNLEYVVIDGQSKDDTLQIAQRYSHRIAKLVSEPDHGIYDALNKGIQNSTGDIIGILHSDDFYVDEKVISRVVDAFVKSGTEAIYGDLEYVDHDDPKRTVRYWASGEYYHGRFKHGWMPPHPSFFIKKSCYAQYGAFVPTLRCSADYELMLRMLHKHRVSVAYLPEVLVKMRVGGLSNASLSNRLMGHNEARLAWKLNGIKPGMLTFVLKPLSKLKQYFQRRKPASKNSPA